MLNKAAGSVTLGFLGIFRIIDSFITNHDIVHTNSKKFIDDIVLAIRCKDGEIVIRFIPW